MYKWFTMPARRVLILTWTVINILFCVTAVSQVTDDEMRKFSHDLLEIDDNIARSAVFDVQTKLKSRPKPEDFATKPLFSTLSADILNRPSYAKFIKLLDNYDWKVETTEVVTREEEAEMDQFLNIILNTKVMKKVKEFLIQKGAISATSNFKTIMYDLWFKSYPRYRQVLGSSGFEHVFVGEVKNKAISGLHNWLQFYLLEKTGNVRYRGYTVNLPLKPPVVLLKFKFAWHEFTKPISTMFIGTSPEFEIGIYTVCYFLKPNEKCPLRLGDKNVHVQTFAQKYKGNTFIGSAYPGLN